MEEATVYILSAARTPIGSFQGHISHIPAHHLGGATIKSCLNRANIPPEAVNEVIIGQVLTAGQGQNPARLAVKHAELPYFVTAHTVNMGEGSGLKAILKGFNTIKSGVSNIVLCGGQENMSLAKHVCYLRDGTNRIGDFHVKDSIYTDAYNPYSTVPLTAENWARAYDVRREEQDVFAYYSHARAVETSSWDDFKQEIVPISCEYTVQEDEQICSHGTLTSFGQLRPIYDNENGTITTGNSACLSDGAAMVALCNTTELAKHDLCPLGKIVSFVQIGIEANDICMGTTTALRQLLEKVNWTVDDVHIFEIEETFAIQPLVAMKELAINPHKLNISGGTISTGLPIGASGAKLFVTLLYNLKHTRQTRGVAVTCASDGIGIAVAIEAFP